MDKMVMILILIRRGKRLYNPVQASCEAEERGGGAAR